MKYSMNSIEPSLEIRYNNPKRHILILLVRNESLSIHIIYPAKMLIRESNCRTVIGEDYSI